jgi:hypothetical protein
MDGMEDYEEISDIEPPEIPAEYDEPRDIGELG